MCLLLSSLGVFPIRLRKTLNKWTLGKSVPLFSQARPGGWLWGCISQLSQMVEVAGSVREEGASGPFFHSLQRSHVWGLPLYTNLCLAQPLGFRRFIKLMSYWIGLVLGRQFGWAGQILGWYAAVEGKAEMRIAEMLPATGDKGVHGSGAWESAALGWATMCILGAGYWPQTGKSLGCLSELIQLLLGGPSRSGLLYIGSQSLAHSSFPLLRLGSSPLVSISTLWLSMSFFSPIH